MLKLDLNLIKEIKLANQPSDLFDILQGAIELEHSTIPPYLTSWYSLIPGINDVIGILIRSIVVEEMLHMTLVANILNALGGKPQINTMDFIPTYPCNLPMNINTSLVIGLEKFSKDLVLNKFMEIEKPEHPKIYPVSEIGLSFLSTEEEYATIGQFYRAIQDKLRSMNFPEDKLPGDPSFQVLYKHTGWNLTSIQKPQDAIDAIDIIIDQGEGTDQSPIVNLSNPAHYYRFEEILKGRKLIQDPKVPVLGYSYSGAVIQCDERQVYPLYPNTKLDQLSDGTQEKESASKFRSSYLNLLNNLHTAFNGKPDTMSSIVDSMYDLTDIAQSLVQTPFPGKPGYNIGLPF